MAGKKTGKKEYKEKQEKDAVVKIDKQILKKVEEFLKRPENKFRYSNKKQIVNLAIIEFLNSHYLIKLNKIQKRGRSYV